jgi:hypothetical protein
MLVSEISIVPAGSMTVRLKRTKIAHPVKSGGGFRTPGDLTTRSPLPRNPSGVSITDIVEVMLIAWQGGSSGDGDMKRVVGPLKDVAPAMRHIATKPKMKDRTRSSMVKRLYTVAPHADKSYRIGRLSAAK